MSSVHSVASSGKVAEMLYHVVCPMLASENCVKCVSDGDEFIFTADILSLLCRIDFEHPVGEFILQALETHKKKYRTGSRTMLFMITRIAKVVSQLQALGIPTCTALKVIETSVAELCRDVEDIAIPVSISSTIQMPQLQSTRKSNVKDQQSELTHYLISEDPDKQHEEINNGSCDRGKVECDVSRTIQKFAPKQPPLCESATVPERDETSKNVTSITSSAEKTFIAESDPVFLKMETEQQSDLEDDILWYFDNSKSDTTSEPRHVSCQGSKNSTVPTTDDIDLEMQCLELSETAVVRLTENSLDKPVFSKSDIAVAENQKQKIAHLHPNTPNLPFVTGEEGHDSDFEDCFDDVENRKHFSLTVEPMSPVVSNSCVRPSVFPPALNPVSKLEHSSCTYNTKGNEDFLLLHNASKHFPRTADFEESPTVSSFKQYISEACDANNQDEFADCFSNDAFDVIHHHIERENNSCSTEATFVSPLRTTKQNGTRVSSISTNCIVGSFQDKNISNSNYAKASQEINCSESFQCANASGQKSEISQVNAMLKSVIGSRSSLSSDFKQIYCRKKMNTQSMPIQGTPIGRVAVERDETTAIDPQTCFIASALKNPKCANPRTSNQTEQASTHDDLLSKLLSEKQTATKRSTSHQIAISSRHLSCSEDNNTSELKKCQSSKPELVCNNQEQLKSGNLGENLSQNPSYPLHTEEMKLVGLGVSSSNCFSTNHPAFKDHLNPTKDLPSHSKPLTGNWRANVTAINDRATKFLPSNIMSLHNCPGAKSPVIGLDGSTSSTKNLSFCRGQGLILPEDAELFIDPELTQIVRQLMQHEAQGEDFSKFNLKLIDCLCTSDSPSAMPEMKESSNFVLPGVVLPCDIDFLQRFTAEEKGQIRRSILVKADLTPHHHHKGYKSTLAKKVLVSSSADASGDTSENLWTSLVVTAITKLGVDLLLVKGKIHGKLQDLLESMGVLVLAHVSYHTLSILASTHNVDMVTYITDALEHHICDIELQPLSENWMDHHMEAIKPQTQFVKIVSCSEVQTVVLSHSNAMSASLAEEKLWKSLNTLSNAIKDRRVLPGAGGTEAWCAEVLARKAWTCLETNKGMQHAILESLSEAFSDFSRLVQKNSEESCRKAIMYDSYCSKIALWEAAVDVVSVITKLDSLVITGIDVTTAGKDLAVL